MRLLRFLKRELGHDIEQWVTDGLISVDQAKQICERYSLVYGDDSGKSRAYSVLMSLGFLFIGLAVITLLGANWEDLPRSLRTGGLISATLASNLFALRFVTSGRSAAATGLFLLGGLLYGASIMLIGQMYHLGVHYADGIFWWALGVLPVALLMRSNTLMLFTTTLAFIWAQVSLDIGYFPVFALIFLAGIAAHLRYNRYNLLLFIALVSGSCLYLQFAPAALLSETGRLRLGAENVLFGFAQILILFSASRWLVAQVQSTRQDYGVLLDVWVLRLTIVTLFCFTFDDVWHELLNAKFEFPAYTLLAVFIACAVAIGISWLRVSRMSGNQLSLMHGLIPSVAGSAGVMILSVYSIYFASTTATFHFQILTNLGVLALGVFLLTRGLIERITHYFFTGVATILLLALIRYFDLIGDYIGASILFTVCAFILLGVASYWKRAHNQQESLA